MLKLIFGRASKSIRLLHSHCFAWRNFISLSYRSGPYWQPLQAKCAISLPGTIEMQYLRFAEKQIFICLDSDHVRCITYSNISDRDRHEPCRVLSMLLWFHDEFQSSRSPRQSINGFSLCRKKIKDAPDHKSKTFKPFLWICIAYHYRQQMLLVLRLKKIWYQTRGI